MPPSPVRGLVIRHAFLWSHEQAAGRTEGQKDRPAVIVLTVKAGEMGGVRVGVVPITHTAPNDPAGAIELPDDVKRSLGLDALRQWVVLDEINRFIWPGFDLRDIPRTSADSYGMLPLGLFDEILRGVLARHRLRKAVLTDRD